MNLSRLKAFVAEGEPLRWPHRIWLGAGRLIIENATNLGELPERAQVVVAPMKVRDANGAPARIFALLAD